MRRILKGREPCGTTRWVGVILALPTQKMSKECAFCEEVLHGGQFALACFRCIHLVCTKPECRRANKTWLKCNEPWRLRGYDSDLSDESVTDDDETASTQSYETVKLYDAESETDQRARQSPTTRPTPSTPNETEQCPSIHPKTPTGRDAPIQTTNAGSSTRSEQSPRLQPQLAVLPRTTRSQSKIEIPQRLATIHSGDSTTQLSSISIGPSNKKQRRY